jgi:prepilin-type N-terminal cleavage/methylation domain-containing protein
MRKTFMGKRQQGFTLLEMMVAVAIFVVICSAIFGLLSDSQKQFRTETQLLGAFQEARLGLDQIVRDVNDAGYPPANHFSTLPAAANYASSPMAWAPGYVAATPCVIGTAGGGTCTTPGDFDAIFEGNVAGTGTNVSWIRYTLTGTTLFRGVIDKTTGTDPVTATSAAGVMLPYVTNVMNNPGATQIAAIRAIYPNMFPGGVAQPIFQYTCDTTSNGTQPCTSALAAGFNAPTNVRDVEITLIVMSQQRDAKTGMIRVVELNGRGHRINPNK